MLPTTYISVYILAMHPNDHKKSDELYRWWSDWYRYSRCSTTDDNIYGDRILIRSNTTPCSTKFIKRANCLPLREPTSIPRVGPFDIETIDVSNRVRQRASEFNWHLLMEA